MHFIHKFKYDLSILHVSIDRWILINVKQDFQSTCCRFNSQMRPLFLRCVHIPSQRVMATKVSSHSCIILALQNACFCKIWQTTSWRDVWSFVRKKIGVNLVLFWPKTLLDGTCSMLDGACEMKNQKRVKKGRDLNIFLLSFPSA